jgi:hypothetical protein
MFASLSKNEQWRKISSEVPTQIAPTTTFQGGLCTMTKRYATAIFRLISFANLTFDALPGRLND